MPLVSFSSGQVIKSADVNANFALCVLTDTARTITVTHTFTPTQTFTAGLTFGTSLSSTTALATPSVYTVTTGTFFASTVSGATLMGFGTTGDVTLKNQAGTDVLVVTQNSLDITLAGQALFTTKLISTTALATPAALVATTGEIFASTVSGATLMGYGTTGDVTLKNRAGTNVIVVTSNTLNVTMAGAAAFVTNLISTTALATPSALSATQFTAFASTVSGATLMGYGTTNDAALMNRAGTVVLGVGPNTTAVNIPGSLVLTGATITGAPTWSSNQAITLSTAAQPNITSVGTLTTLACGAITATGNLQINATNARVLLGAASDTFCDITFQNISGTDKWRIGRGLVVTSNNDLIIYDAVNSARAITITAGAAPAIAFNGAGSGFTTLSGTGAVSGFTTIACTSSYTSGAPSGGTAAAWKLGVASVTSPTSPNRTIQLDVAGTLYYLAAKTTND